MIDKTIKGVGWDITYMSLSFFKRISLQSNVTSYLLFGFLNFMKLEKKTSIRRQNDHVDTYISSFKKTTPTSSFPALQSCFDLIRTRISCS